MSSAYNKGMTMKGVLSSRDKNDVFWDKKRKYVLSANIKNKTEGSYFHPDVAAEVKSAYDRYDSAFLLHELTGNEFMDHPPTASGQTSFAKSIAEMMHTLERLDRSVMDEHAVLDPTASFFMDIIDDAKKLIGEIVEAFFAGCGTDRDGNTLADKSQRSAARKTFFEKRKEYEILIKTERKIAGSEMIDIIRDAKGIEEYQKTDLSGDDPRLEKLLAKKKIPEEYSERISALCELSKAAGIEIAEAMVGKEALWGAIREKLTEEDQSETRKKLLQSGFDAYAFDVDMNIRRLLYRRDAVCYLIRWFLSGEPVDDITAKRIAEISDEKPEVFDPADSLHQIIGFCEPVEKAEDESADSDPVRGIIRLGDEVRQYLYRNPSQFEAQSLLSLAADTEGLADVLSRAWSLSKRMDELTLSGKYADLDPAEQQHLFDIWVQADTVCRVGDPVLELIMENGHRTIGEATDLLEGMLPEISYSMKEKISRDTLAKVILERSGMHVY